LVRSLTRNEYWVSLNETVHGPAAIWENMTIHIPISVGKLVSLRYIAGMLLTGWCFSQTTIELSKSSAPPARNPGLRAEFSSERSGRRPFRQAQGRSNNQRQPRILLRSCHQGFEECRTREAPCRCGGWIDDAAVRSADKLTIVGKPNTIQRSGFFL
jgi:hypothetical protein